MRSVERGTPSPPLPRRTLAEETLVVLSLSLLASAAFAILSLFELPIRGVRVASVSQSAQLARQLLGPLFALAPVWLVVYLVRRNGEGLSSIGLAWDRPREDLLRGFLLFVVVGLGGIGVYLGAVALGVNRFVVPVPPLGHWWTVPVLFVNAIQAALLEEVVVVAYLVTRLRQLGMTQLAAVGASALLRGTYHLYQGWGGFLGNLAMGVLFGLVFLRTRRAWPIVIAHLLLDVAAGIGYIAFREHLPGGLVSRQAPGLGGPFDRRVELSDALQRTASEGFAHLDGVLTERFCEVLWHEIESGPMRRMAGTFGAAGVRMEIDGFDVESPFEGFPFVAELSRALTERIRSEGAAVHGLATWRPNEAGVGVYRPGSVGVTAHMDGRWYRRLVAVFTLVGAARFEVRAAREGEPIEAWDARAGGVTFMRGPGLAGARDGRPYHAVYGPKRGVRCSLALRMSVREPKA